MLKFRCLLAASLVAAAVSADAQTTPAPAPRPQAPAQAPAQPPAQAPAQPPAQAPAQPPAQAPKPSEGTMPICGGMYQIGPPATLPPANSGPVIYQVAACFEKQGGYSVVDPQTYLYYMEIAHQVPIADKWFPYDEKAEQTIVGDFKRLWATNFLDDLSAETYDYVFSNGVVGKVIVYNMEERQRVKIVDYVGSKKVEMSKIDDELKKKGLRIALDSFIDPGLVKQVAGVVRDLYADEGYEYAEVKPEVKPVSTATKTVNLTFHITEGPKVRIKHVDFQGNTAIADGTLARKMKDNKGPNPWLFLFSHGGTYKESKFEDDADKVQQFYREEGYVKAQIGQPQLRILEDDADGRTRWVELQVPVTEGPRYRVGEINFSGNTVVKTEGLRPLFKIEPGDWFNEKKIRKGFEKAREVYGSGGYFEFTGAPEYSFPGDPKDPNAGGGPAGPPAPASSGPPAPDGAAAAASAAPGAPAAPGKKVDSAPVVNVTMRLEEGKQYFVHRITFAGNTTTRDNVIRREMRLYEGNVFNTEALKYSVKRLNQLGYFKPLEGEAIDVQKTPDADNQVDVRLKFEEQNRNQITFGAGVSQYEGFFGQLAFQTSNFMGRGETFSVSAQQGNRAKNYQVGFTEPFLFDRPITAGINVFNQEIQYIGQFTQASKGMNTVWGFPVGPFARLFATYSYQAVRVKDLNPLYTQSASLGGLNNPFLAETLLTKENGERKISKIGPSYQYNTVDNPIFPTTGRKFTAAVDLAGLGGNTKYYDANIEAVGYFKHTNRTSLGVRAAWQYISPYGGSVLPIFEKVFLGGEYSIRGFDIRSVGPRDPATQLVIGGNKSILGNAEYLINIAGPVRLVLFYDIGQVRDVGEHFSMTEPIKQLVYLNRLGAADSLSALYTVGGFTTNYNTRIDTVGTTSAFKTSTGAEIRFFMPVLNVPFRLIFAMNPQRGNVLDNNLRPEKLFKFRFAVGTTF